MAKTYNELNDLVAKQEKIILSQQKTIDTLVNDLNSKEDKITSSNKLESDLVDDTNQTHKFVSEQDKTSWNGKSVIVANPTLSGTEETLNGLEVNGVKYKAGGGGSDIHLYQHDIMLTDFKAKITIFNNSQTPFTVETLYNYLNNNGYNTSSKLYSVNGGYARKGTASGYYNTIDVYVGIYAQTVANKFKLVSSSLNIKFDTDNVYTYSSSAANNDKSTNVEEILGTPIAMTDNVITIF